MRVTGPLCQAELKGVRVQALAALPAGCTAPSECLGQTPFLETQMSQLSEPSFYLYSLFLGGIPKAFGFWLQFAFFSRLYLTLGDSSIYETEHLPPEPLQGNSSNLGLSARPCLFPRIFCGSWGPSMTTSHSPDPLALPFPFSPLLVLPYPKDSIFITSPGPWSILAFTSLKY